PEDGAHAGQGFDDLRLRVGAEGVAYLPVDALKAIVQGQDLRGRPRCGHVLIRLGRWQDILELELPEGQELFGSTTAVIHYARGAALSALGRIPEAEAARADFTAAAARVPDTRLNSVPAKEADALKVAAAILEGELECRKGNFDEAFAALRRAIALEDALRPPLQRSADLAPARAHAYGALLTEQGRPEEAVAVYRADLYLDRTPGRRRTRPNNVWSLHGLHECLTRLGRQNEADEIALHRDIAVAAADALIAASCFCRLSATCESPSGC
ncbi:hypothetical protein ACWEP4_27820, partial [Streptomyces sp. NPDC004227]